MLSALKGFSRGRCITVRRYRQSDASVLERTIREIGENVLGHGLKHWMGPYEDQRGAALTAEIDGAPVGFACVEEYGDGVLLFHSDVVSPSRQGRGAGTALTLVRMAIASPSEVSWLGLLSTEHSRTFYERFGFAVEGESTRDPFFKLTLNQMAVGFSETLRDAAEGRLRDEGIACPQDLHYV